MKRQQGILLVISAPSGAGKTTVITRLLNVTKRMRRSISTTTRTPRKGEREGRDYFFVSQAVFRGMRRRGAFAEWAKVHQGVYGTSRRFLDRMLRSGYDVVLNIDVQGGRSIAQRYPRETVLVFLRPPSWRELQRRLLRRGDQPREVIRARLRVAKQELKASARYHYQVVNDRVEWAVKRIQAILQAEKLKTGRQVKI